MNVSIVIPSYNSERTIEDCLNAIVTKDVEVIVVDDGSTDRTIEIIKKFNEVKLLKQKHAGPSKARNLGVKNAKGEIILFIDSDVVLKTNELSELGKKFNENKSLVAIQGEYTKFSFFKNLSSMYKDLYYFHYFKNSVKGSFPPISTHCLAIRKNTFQKLGGFDSKIKEASIEDAELGLKLKNISSKRVILDRLLKVQHMKKYTFFSLIKTDYTKGFNTLKLLLRIKEKDRLINITSTKVQMFCFIGAIIFSVLSMLAFFLFIFIEDWSFFVLSVVFYLVINFSLFKTFFKEAKYRAPFLIGLNFVSNLFVAIAIMHGLFDVIILRRKY